MKLLEARFYNKSYLKVSILTKKCILVREKLISYNAIKFGNR